MNTPDFKNARTRGKEEVKIIRGFKIKDEYKHLGDNKKYYVRTY